jgi:RP/EB family microtubule-associated protein
MFFDINLAASGGSSEATAKVQELTTQLAEMKTALEGLEKERDFYFGKLRDIEILCQGAADQNNETLQSIFRILYATDESQEFVSEEAQPQEEVVQEEVVQENPPEEEIESF